MQTVITGTPGAGKTLYAISKLLRSMLGQKVSVTLDDGKVVEYERKIYTNISGLTIEHELVENGAAWEGNDKAGWKQADGGNKLGWHNWHEWAKPGAILVVDEFQRTWPPRPNGAPVPPDVSAMDTHRHKGVDFILITQSPNRFDSHIAGLVGRHLHVRRLANMHAALVYEWDHLSRSLIYRNAMSKTPWRYDKSVFKLYHSADAHTKQPRKMPTLVWVVLAALVIGAWKIPESVARISGKQEEHQSRMEKLGLKSGAAVPNQTARAAEPLAPAPLPVSAQLGAASQEPAKPAELEVAGCIQVREVCRCFTSDGKALKPGPGQCEGASGSGPLATSRQSGGSPGGSARDDGAVLAFMSGRKPLTPLVGDP